MKLYCDLCCAKYLAVYYFNHPEKQFHSFNVIPFTEILFNGSDPSVILSLFMHHVLTHSPLSSGQWGMADMQNKCWAYRARTDIVYSQYK